MSIKTELSRVAVAKPTSINEAKAELAEKAKRLLGYTRLAGEVTDIRIRTLFAELGIEPLNLDKVMRYKAKRERGEATWRLTELSRYSEEVPLFAISRAAEIKERLPEANFYVDHLVYAPKNRDPFMVVEYGQKQYYLDVWDEPEFEGRRTI